MTGWFPVSISAGVDHTCALFNGYASCWGKNDYGQLGVPAQVTQGTPDPGVVFVALIDPAIKIGAGNWHSCALGADGRVACWGAKNPQDGIISYVDYVGWGTDDIYGPARDLSVGPTHNCVVLADGGVACWAGHEYGCSSGECGPGYSFVRPRRIDNLGTVAAVSAGRRHTCALRLNGETWCLGDNGRGQLGDGTFASSEYPVRVYSEFLGEATTVAAGGAYTCAAGAKKRYYCWGDNTFGQLGDATAYSHRNTPLEVAGGHDAASPRAVALGWSHSCSLKGGAVSCWGDGTLGQVGNRSDLPFCAASRRWFGTSSRECGDRCGPYMRGSNRLDGVVLGRELLWPARQRHQRERHDGLTRGVVIRAVGFGRHVAFLRADRGWRRLVLG